MNLREFVLLFISLFIGFSHQSGEVAMASFYRMDSESSHLPSMLSALEEQNFLFQLQLNNQPQDDSNEVGCHYILCDNRL